MNNDDSAPDQERPPGRLSRLLGLASNLILLALVTAFAAFIGGYVLFLSEVAGIRRPAEPAADAIIVLTGGYQRIEEAVRLLDAGAGKRLLISGVNRATTMAQIRRFTGSSKDLFDCCVDVGYDAQDTTGNAAEAVAWIAARRFSSVIVVTNDYHLPRALMELRRIDPATRYIAWPVEAQPLALDHVFAHPYLVVTLSMEYLKTLAVVLRDGVPDWTMS